MFLRSVPQRCIDFPLLLLRQGNDPLKRKMGISTSRTNLGPAALLASSVVNGAVAVTPGGSQIPTKSNKFRSQRGLTQQQNGFSDDSSFQKSYTDSLGTFYAEAAQAWRILGAYIECSDMNRYAKADGEDYNDGRRRRRQRRRHLEGQENGDGDQNHDSGSGDGSGDAGDDDGDENSSQCSRYLLWAAVSLCGMVHTCRTTATWAQTFKMFVYHFVNF